MQLGESHNFSSDSYYTDRVKSTLNCGYVRCFVADENQSSTMVGTIIQEYFHFTSFTVYYQNNVKYTVRREFKIEFYQKKKNCAPSSSFLRIGTDSFSVTKSLSKFCISD